MKKITLTALLMGLATLSSCSMIPSLQPTEEPNVLSSILPGEIPSGGEQVSFEEIEDLFNDTQETTTYRNGLEININNSKLVVSRESTYANQYNSKNVDGYTLKVEDVNANVKLTGLTTADHVNKFAASANASGKLTAKSYYNDDVYTDVENLSLNEEAYLKEGTVYCNFSNELMELIGGTADTQEYKFYTALPEDLQEVILESGLTLPLLTDINVAFIESMMEQMNNQNKEDLSVMAVLLTDEDVIKTIYENLFTLSKFNEDYLLSLDLNKDNIDDKVTTILDSLYTNGTLDKYIASNMGQSSFTQEQFNELKDQLLQQVAAYTNDFSHAKLSVVFDKVMVKSLGVDFKYDYNYTMNSMEYTYLHTISYELVLNMSFNYSDSVSVTYPDFSSYIDIEELYK